MSGFIISASGGPEDSLVDLLSSRAPQHKCKKGSDKKRAKENLSPSSRDDAMAYTMRHGDALFSLSTLACGVSAGVSVLPLAIAGVLPYDSALVSPLIRDHLLCESEIV